MKYQIPAGTEGTFCKGCRARIFWIKTKNGKNMPVDTDGEPHWATCQVPSLFRSP